MGRSTLHTLNPSTGKSHIPSRCVLNTISTLRRKRGIHKEVIHLSSQRDRWDHKVFANARSLVAKMSICYSFNCKKKSRVRYTFVRVECTLAHTLSVILLI